jgi:hypothetical protein
VASLGDCGRREHSSYRSKNKLDESGRERLGFANGGRRKALGVHCRWRCRVRWDRRLFHNQEHVGRGRNCRPATVGPEVIVASPEKGEFRHNGRGDRGWVRANLSESGSEANKEEEEWRSGGSDNGRCGNRSGLDIKRDSA